MLWVHHGSLPEAWTWALEQGARLVRARFVLGEPRRLPDDAPLPWRLGDEAPDLRAFAGIARPEAFFRMLRGAGANLCGKRIFPDHHAYSAQELEDLAAWGAGRVLVTTAKDAVRIRESAPDFDCAVLPMALCLEEGESLLDEALGHIADPRGSP
jgi:tetraacyldisaccharide-1-P 4'-kinase